MRHLLIHSPYARLSGQGNSVTALRMENILAQLGYRISHSEANYDGEAADIMIALNARKSAHAIARFRYQHPDAGLVIVLTGTDINHPDIIDEKSKTCISMKLADRLVVLHEASLQQVPERFREKTHVIYPSVQLPEGISHSPDEDDFSIIMAGNMRKEKNPQLAVIASVMITPYIRIHVYGEYPEPASDRITKHGVVSHDEILNAMSKARLLLNTSFQEGGANAICEAVSMGLPVIATAIPGNIGMLGEDYAGLFPSDDDYALVKIIEKAAKDHEFYAQLKRQVSARAPLFLPDREAASWSDLIEQLLK